MPSSSSPSSEPPLHDQRSVRRLLLVPVVVCTGQAIALLILGVGGLFADTDQRGAAIAEAITLFVLAAGLLWMATGLLRFRSWARGPVIATELIVVLVALSWAGPTTLLGWAVGLPAGAALAVVLLPRVVQAMAADGSAGSAGPDPDQAP